ncbi:MAG: prepilin-type N-terminal cleavage/methylation domain-containing protein [Deltaproteobacteria bacterium]|nr:prepilin-type N-terminal cleavage/methylation domain-containing protein [Deltaproteobacteria bacterium]
MKRHGFSLIEIMIVVAIIGILASVAIPLYTGHIRKARRSEAMTGLQTVALYEEKCMAEKGNYNTITYLINSFGLSDPDGDKIYEPSDFYNISLFTQTSTLFVVQGVPIGAQAGDNITLAVHSDGRVGRIVLGNFVEDRTVWGQ